MDEAASLYRTMLVVLDATLSRRARLRAETASEIKTVALKHMAANGTAAVSLRAIARDMGMTAGAIYSYFETRDALIAGRRGSRGRGAPALRRPAGARRGRMAQRRIAELGPFHAEAVGEALNRLVVALHCGPLQTLGGRVGD